MVGLHAELVISGLAVDSGHAGSMLGYDRRAEQGPWLVRTLVRRLHRHAGHQLWDEVRRVHWDGRRVIVEAGGLQPLTTP